MNQQDRILQIKEEWKQLQPQIENDVTRIQENLETNSQLFNEYKNKLETHQKNVNNMKNLLNKINKFAK